MPHSVSSEGFLRTADRALLVLTAFTEQGPEHGVTDLAGRLGLDKSQVQRLLKSLVRRDFVVFDSRAKTYRLGPALVGLGRLAERGDGLTAVVRPALRALAAETGESAVFNVADSNRYRCAVAVDQPRPFRYSSSVGHLFPGHGGASGHAIFAHYFSEEIRPLFGGELTAATGTTITSLDQLRRRYAEVRAAGYAVSFGEHDPGVVAVAAPVFARGAIFGSVVVLGAAEHLGGQPTSVIDALRATADELTARFDAERSESD